MAGRTAGATRNALSASERGQGAVFGGGPVYQGDPPRNEGSQTLVLDNFPSPALARSLSPNGRVHWARRHDAKREAAHRMACEALLQRIVPVEGPVRLAFGWVFPTQGRHDLDNLIATAKPLIDALVTAGVLQDDDSRHVVGISAEVRVERGQRRLEVTLAPAAPAGEEG